jgi:hypothetical protein
MLQYLVLCSITKIYDQIFYSYDQSGVENVHAQPCKCFFISKKVLTHKNSNKYSQDKIEVKKWTEMLLKTIPYRARFWIGMPWNKMYRL